MKKITSFFLFMITFGMATWAFAAENNFFQEANTKYKEGDYKAAVLLYEKLIASGNTAAETYYNLGNAHFRAGMKGKAFLDYERAHRLNPRDQDIEWNKSILKNALPDRIDDSSDNVFISSVQKLLDWITMDEAAFLSIALLGLLFLTALISFFSQKSKSMTMGLGGFLLFLWILSAFVFYGKWLAQKDPVAVVLDAEVSARYGPSDKETKAFVLHEGASAKILDQTQDWYYIRLQDKNTGWIAKKSCEII